MITDTYFITEAYLREKTPLSQNLDIKDIVPNIGPAQDMHIQDILGTNFYNYLLGVYSAQTLSANEVTLVMHIKPALAYRAAEMSLPFIQYQVKNKGPQTQSGDFSAAVDLPQLSYLRNELRNRSEHYETRLRKFLCMSGTLFTQYITNNNADMIPNKANDGFDSDFGTYGDCNYGKRCDGFNGFYNFYK